MGKKVDLSKSINQEPLFDDDDKFKQEVMNITCQFCGFISHNVEMPLITHRYYEYYITCPNCGNKIQLFFSKKDREWSYNYKGRRRKKKLDLMKKIEKDLEESEK